MVSRRSWSREYRSLVITEASVESKEEEVEEVEEGREEEELADADAAADGRKLEALLDDGKLEEVLMMES